MKNIVICICILYMIEKSSVIAMSDDARPYGSTYKLSFWLINYLVSNYNSPSPPFRDNIPPPPPQVSSPPTPWPTCDT